MIYEDEMCECGCGLTKGQLCSCGNCHCEKCDPDEYNRLKEKELEQK